MWKDFISQVDYKKKKWRKTNIPSGLQKKCGKYLITEVDHKNKKWRKTNISSRLQKNVEKI